MKHKARNRILISVLLLVLVGSLGGVSAYSFRLHKELDGSRLSYKNTEAQLTSYKTKYQEATSDNVAQSLNFVPVSEYNQQKSIAEADLGQVGFLMTEKDNLQSQVDNLQTQLNSCQSDL